MAPCPPHCMYTYMCTHTHTSCGLFSLSALPLPDPQAGQQHHPGLIQCLSAEDALVHSFTRASLHAFALQLRPFQLTRLGLGLCTTPTQHLLFQDSRSGGSWYVSGQEVQGARRAENMGGCTVTRGLCYSRGSGKALLWRGQSRARQMSSNASHPEQREGPCGMERAGAKALGRVRPGDSCVTLGR